MSTKFKLEFIKYYPELRETYRLAPLDILVYWYIKTIIEFQNNNSCFATSKTIAKSLYASPQSIDNSINKLKKSKLIETDNPYIQEYNIKRRYIYLYGQRPRYARNQVDEFFDENDIIQDNAQTRAIVGNLIFKYDVLAEDIINFCEEQEDVNYPLDENELRNIYIPVNGVVAYTN